MARTLTTFDQVVEVLGGVTAAAGLIGRRPANLCQWRRKYGRFPAALWFRVNDVLALRKCQAVAEVFRFELPRKTAAWPGKAGKARRGESRSGMVWRSEAGPGRARQAR